MITVEPSYMHTKVGWQLPHEHSNFNWELWHSVLLKIHDMLTNKPCYIHIHVLKTGLSPGFDLLGEDFRAEHIYSFVIKRRDCEMHAVLFKWATLPLVVNSDKRSIGRQTHLIMKSKLMRSLRQQLWEVYTGWCLDGEWSGVRIVVGLMQCSVECVGWLVYI